MLVCKPAEGEIGDRNTDGIEAALSRTGPSAHHARTCTLHSPVGLRVKMKLMKKNGSCVLCDVSIE